MTAASALVALTSNIYNSPEIMISISHINKTVPTLEVKQEHREQEHACSANIALSYLFFFLP